MTRKWIWSRPDLGPVALREAMRFICGPRAGRLQVLAVALGLASCVAPDTRHRIVVSIPEQRLALLDNGALIATYPISTSKFTIGDAPGSRGTPLGELEIAKKIGDSAPSGMVFKDRRPTGEILVPNAPGRDPIVTRILWLKGIEPRNPHAYGRYIYVHGAPVENQIGKPASYGCIRMRSQDILRVFTNVGVGTRVDIVEDHLPVEHQAIAHA